MTADWDPKPQERQYVRHRMTGDLGWLVTRDGKECVRYDRPNIDHHIAVRRDDKGLMVDWVDEKPPAPLNAHHVAMVAFQTDQELLRHLGEIGKKRAWLDMREEERHRFIKEGPGVGGIRHDVWLAVQQALEPYTKA